MILDELKNECRGSYLGTLSELIQPIKDKYDIPLRVGLKGLLNHLVVDTTETAQKVDQFLTEKSLYMDTLILSKVPESPDQIVLRSMRQKVGKHGTLLIDVVQFSHQDPKLQNAVKYLCGEKAVVDNLDAAISLGRKGVQSVTHDGTQFKNGLITGGYYAEGKKLGPAKLDQTISTLLKSVRDITVSSTNLRKDIEKEEENMRSLKEA